MPSFPYTQEYNYVIGDSFVFPDKQKLIINRMPMVKCLVVNDRMNMIKTRAITLVLFMQVPVPVQKGDDLFLETDDYDPIQFKPLENSFFYGNIQIGHQPFVYKYVLVKKNGQRQQETGRPHIAFVHAPITSKLLIIYDNWAFNIPVFSYYHRPIQAGCSLRLSPLFTFDYVPSKTKKCAYLSFNGKNPEPCFHEGCWRFEREIPITSFGFLYQVGTCMHLNEPISWVQDKGFKIFPVEKTGIDAMAVRQDYGDAKQRAFGVYIPLVSLNFAGQSVGDFYMLLEFAKWCKKCGISQIHTHIERMNEGRLIDPIHALAPNVLVANLDIESIREAKIISLHDRYQFWKREYEQNDEEYKQFVQRNEWMKEICKTEFELWVQFNLAVEYQNCFEGIVELGIDLITDIVLYENTSIKSLLKVESKRAQIIRLVGLLNSLTPLTVERVHEVCGDDTQFVLENYCKVYDDTVIFEEKYRNPELIEQIPEPEFKEKIKRLFTMSIDQKKYESCQESMQRLPMLPPQYPCAIMLDQATTSFLTIPRTYELHYIPSSSNHEGQFASFVEPKYLSPEIVSEFDQVSTQQEMAQIIESRVKSNAISVVIYLQDLLSAFGVFLHPQVKPLQLIEHHCRFTFPVSIEDLNCNTDLITKVREFLETNNRSPI